MPIKISADSIPENCNDKKQYPDPDKKLRLVYAGSQDNSLFLCLLGGDITRDISPFLYHKGFLFRYFITAMSLFIIIMNNGL